MPMRLADAASTLADSVRSGRLHADQGADAAPFSYVLAGRSQACACP